MVDFVSKEKRSNIMRGVKGKNTRPEIRVRSLLHRSGFRFRLHDPRLPGRPDITLPRYRTAVFVHGCFWHNHAGCPSGRIPASNSEFWRQKIARTLERDARHEAELTRLGWTVLTVWECELSDEATLVRRLESALKVA